MSDWALIVAAWAAPGIALVVLGAVLERRNRLKNKTFTADDPIVSALVALAIVVIGPFVAVGALFVAARTMAWDCVPVIDAILSRRHASRDD